jgi:hypothetical protein
VTINAGECYSFIGRDARRFGGQAPKTYDGSGKRYTATLTFGVMTNLSYPFLGKSKASG